MAPGIAFAATLAAFPASVALKTGDAVQFTLLIQSSDSINTIGTAVVLPPGLTFLSASDGPVITQWVQHPTFDKPSNSVEFSGIIPDGWSGKGTLATVKVAALQSGTYSLNFDPSQTEIYKNDGNATPEKAVFGTISSPLETLPFYFGLAVVLAVVLLLVQLFRRKYKILFV